MKNLISSILFGFLAISCHRSSDNNTAPLDQLPAVTQTGANTAGCLVNGKVLLPRGQKIQNGTVLAAKYQFLNGGYHFGLNIDDNSDSALPGIGIGSDNVNFEIGKTYILGENLYDNSKINIYADYINFNNGDYKTTSSITGELKFSRLDTINFIASGTFWFDAVNNNGEKVQVREGRFDLHYAP